MYRLTTPTGWRLVTPPTAEVLTLAEAKAQCRVTHTAEDTFIESLIPVAREYIESRNRILAIQTWEMLLDGFPADGVIQLWKNPVQSVDLITYVDYSTELVTTWDAADYQVALTSEPARITLAPNGSWPSTLSQSEAVVVRFTAGYISSPPSIPALLMHAMKLLIAHLYVHREAVIEDRVVELPIGLEHFIESAIGKARVY